MHDQLSKLQTDFNYLSGKSVKFSISRPFGLDDAKKTKSERVQGFIYFIFRVVYISIYFYFFPFLTIVLNYFITHSPRLILKIQLEPFGPIGQ